MTVPYDVIVVGKGNAALCSALSAHENGAKVLMLEAASEDESGGNSRFAGGVMRFAYESVADLKRVTELTDEEIAKVRGTHFNVGDGLRMALDIGAAAGAKS